MGRYKFKDRKFPKDFQTVADYIHEKKSIQVSLGTETDFLGYFNRQIIIHHNYDLCNNGLYILLYEVAKVLNPFKLNKYFNGDKSSIDILKFIYESSLWERGMEIADELGIDINKEEYEIFKIKNLTEIYKNN